MTHGKGRVVTDKEWQERYMITSTKGRIWTRSEVRKRAVDTAYRLLMHEQPRTVIRTDIELALDDDKFMRQRYGMVPARVIEDAAFEAFFKLSPKSETKP
jgi:hypothetical protein